MTNSDFFQERKEQSLIKSKIVESYFRAWSQIILPRVKQQEDKLKQKQNLAYIDLFAGPGRYQDGTESTPLQILTKVLQNSDLRERLLTVFNDSDSENVRLLQRCINSIPHIDQLHHQPIIKNKEIDESIINDLVLKFTKSIPTLFFIDPWGYKGLSLQLINSAIQNWGCDCIFFFNYNRVNMGLNNKYVEKHMNALFGKERADILREKLNSMSSIERELTIVEEICQALQEEYANYVLPFCFKNSSRERTSHHLIFVSKNPTAYSVMKDIMAEQSSEAKQGVASFEYNPATQYQPLLFQLQRPLDHLEDMLLNDFKGQTLTVKNIIEKHHVGTPYIKKNYKEVLKKLENKGKIKTTPSISERKKNTMAEEVRITFPQNPDDNIGEQQLSLFDN